MDNDVTLRLAQIPEKLPTLTDEQKLRAARRLVEEVLAGESGRLPMAGQQLEGVRQALGMLAGDNRPDDPGIAALARAEQTIRAQQTVVEDLIAKWRIDVDFMTANPERRAAVIDCRKELTEAFEDVVLGSRPATGAPETSRETT